MWGSPIPGRSRLPSLPRMPITSSAALRESSRWRRRPCTSRPRPSRTACTRRTTAPCRRPTSIRRRRCRYTSGTPRPSSWRSWDTEPATSTRMRTSTPTFSVLAAVLGACATLGRLSFKEPELQLEAINITGLGLTGGTFDLVFDVYNPNDYRIRSTRLEVGVDLEGTHFGDALLERPLDLSPTNHSRVVVPVRFEW